MFAAVGDQNPNVVAARLATAHSLKVASREKRRKKKNMLPGKQDIATTVETEGDVSEKVAIYFSWFWRTLHA